MNRIFRICGLMFVLSSCGQDAYIAKKVKFRVFFPEQTVQVKFEIDPQYRAVSTNTFTFESLGSLFIRKNSEITEVGANLRASPETLEHSWPTDSFKRFPNGSRLPPSVPSGELRKWSIQKPEISTDLLFQAKPNLIAGGGIRSDKFDFLPKEFLATQKFYTANLEVQATISVAGRVGEQPGGIYFFGNFGVNPFVIPDSENLRGEMSSTISPTDFEWELEATEPAWIAQFGELRAWQSSSDCLVPGCLFEGEKLLLLKGFAP